jgi:3'(2'), 5'-bisphosphate nucleotidase
LLQNKFGDPLLANVIEIARQAGLEIMKFYKTNKISIHKKLDDSPVTEADLNAHQIIFEALSQISDAPIISEESDASKELDLRDSCFWLVDPLDGTRDFIAGADTFCVSIALVDHGVPILGVLFSPVFNEMFSAELNEGAFLNGVKIFNSNTQAELSALASGAAQVSARMQNFLQRSNIKRVSRFGSALKFAYLSRGDADLYPRFGETSEWDTAGGQIICQEAGCAILDLQSLEVMRYAKANFRNEGFIAVRLDLVDTFRKIILELRQSVEPEN